MFYLEHLIKKYGQASKKEMKPKNSVVSVKFKPGAKPKSKPLHETIDLATGKPVRSTYAPGGPKVKMPAEVKAIKAVKEKIWDIPAEYWKKKLSEDEMSFVNDAINKIAKKRYSEAAKERMGVRASGTPKKVEETYEAIRESPKSREWIRKHPYKGRSPKARAASIAWAGYKKSKKAEFDVPTILEKIGADPNLVETAKELERLSEQAGRKTLLDFWQRLGRAALSARILATPEVRREMMREKALVGGAIGAPLGGLVGYAVKPTVGGALTGAAIGGVGSATLGAYLAKRKSQRAATLLRDPMAQRALVTELAAAIKEQRPAELL